MNENEDYKTSPAFLSSSCPQSHRLHFKDLVAEPGFASPSFLAPI